MDRSPEVPQYDGAPDGSEVFRREGLPATRPDADRPWSVGDGRVHAVPCDRPTRPRCGDESADARPNCGSSPACLAAFRVWRANTYTAAVQFQRTARLSRRWSNNCGSGTGTPQGPGSPQRSSFDSSHEHPIHSVCTPAGAFIISYGDTVRAQKRYGSRMAQGPARRQGRNRRRISLALVRWFFPNPSQSSPDRH